MIMRQPDRSICTGACVGMLLLFQLIATPAAGQIPSSRDYYEICRNLGYMPRTVPMRDCIETQRNNDLDPLNALVEHELVPPAAHPPRTPRFQGGADFSGAQSPKDVLDSTPEELLLGPDSRAPSQGIYE